MEMERATFLFTVIYFIGIWHSEAARRNGQCFHVPSANVSVSMCNSDQFRCLNNKCITRGWFCDNDKDCEDESDEKYCNTLGLCPASYTLCRQSRKCIPTEWVCNGNRDCSANEDESNCAPSPPKLAREVELALSKAIQWLKSQIHNVNSNDKWGAQVPKRAVSLFLTDKQFSSPSNSDRMEMGHEISIQLLSHIARKKLEDISSTDLSTFVNALLVTCLDPRQFYGMNLIQELRHRTNTSSYVNPYIYLTLCNAGEAINLMDKGKLIQAFWNEMRPLWIGMKALVIMALSCAKNQTDSVVNEGVFKELTLDLKSYQYRNGTVANLQTTALVLQALYASQPDDDPETFDEEKALQQILQKQKPNGSFGSFMKTYYVLPVLSCRSLANINSYHCQAPSKDEETAEQYLLSQTGPKVQIEYSIWIGNERSIGRTLSLRVQINTTLYRMMEIASDLDIKYKFEYVMHNRKPYVTCISDLADDPENGKFWFLYVLNDTFLTLIDKSPADVILKNNENFVMWYRRGPWLEQNTSTSEGDSGMLAG